MKKILLVLLCLSFGNLKAQLLDGDIAPDFTFNDINGNQQHLYSYLNSNKFVLLELSTTWCSPCWQLHDSFHTMQIAYNTFDAGGDHTGKILFIEADPMTTMADLQGTGSATQGDWLTGTNFTIINPDSVPQPGETNLSLFNSQYSGFGFPRLVLICPNKQIWQDTLNNIDKTNPWPPSVVTMQWLANTKCNIPTGLDELNDTNPITIYPNPVKDNFTLLFSLQKSSKVLIKLVNIIGQEMYAKEYEFLNKGDQQINIHTSSLAKGIYSLSLSTKEGRVITKKISVID